MRRAVVVAVALGLLSHAAVFYFGRRTAPRCPVAETRVEYRDRVKVEQRVVHDQGETRVVAGPVRTVTVRQLVAGRCQETTTTERAPVTVEKHNTHELEVQTRQVQVVKVEVRQVPTPPPRFQLELRGGLDVHATPFASLAALRFWGPLGIGAWLEAALPASPRAAGLALALRF